MRYLLFLVVLFVASVAHADVAPPASIEDWLYDATVAWVQPYALSGDVAESVDEAIARRRAIAASVWAAASDPKTPRLFSGPRGRELTALFVLGVWKEESHFDLRVDKHHCKGMPKTYCDSGSAWCLGQVHPKDVPQLGFTGPELQGDNVKCALATIHRLAAARAGAPKTAPHDGDLFCGYAVGHYQTPCHVMRLRYSYAASWSKAHPPPAI